MTRLLARAVALSIIAATASGSIAAAQTPAPAAAAVTRPAVSDVASPTEEITPVASDGHRGFGLLRKPPGNGPFPAVVVIHGGLTTAPRELLNLFNTGPMASRFLAAGYVVAVITYRSRSDDPQNPVSIVDAVAAVDYVRRLPYVDPKSTAIYGCSGGGDLALQVAAATDVAAIAPEEPATVLFTGVFNTGVAKAGTQFTPADVATIMRDPAPYYTAKYQAITREKLGRIRAPMLILQGDLSLETNFNTHVFLPELKHTGKTFEVITYRGEPHCFAFTPRAPRPAVALKAFQDTDAFFRKHLPTQPRPVDPSLIDYVPVLAADPVATLSFAITTSGAEGKQYAGTWRMRFPSARDATFALTIAGASVTGTFRFVDAPQSEALTLFDGQIAGDSLTFKVKSPTGERTITFVGTVNGDELTWKRDVQVPPNGLPGGTGLFGAGGPARFVARRAP